MLLRIGNFHYGRICEHVVRFLEFNEYRILKNKGSISKFEADQKAKDEYKEFNKKQPIQSDFDKQIKKYLGSGNSE